MSREDLSRHGEAETLVQHETETLTKHRDDLLLLLSTHQWSDFDPDEWSLVQLEIPDAV